MKTALLILLVIVFYSGVLFSQESSSWGNDVLVSSTEPLGKFSSVAKPNGTVYMAIPDTNITAGYSLRVYKSTNFGNNWSLMPNGIQPAGVVNKVKMVEAGPDSVYAVYTLGGTLYVWNVETNNLNQFTNYTNLRDFDAAGSSTGAVYIIVDLSTNRDLRMASTLNGGATWGGAVFLSSTGAHPKMTKSQSGDTLLINYYGPVISDTANSIIRGVRYRETAPGTIASISGSFIDIATENVPKEEFMSVYGPNGTIWFYYTSGISPNIDLKVRTSVTSGSSYSSAIDVAADANVNESGLYAAYNTLLARCDLVYNRDSSAAIPTPERSMIVYRSSLVLTPGVFTPPIQINQRPAISIVNGYSPVLAEFDDAAGDIGITWVGMDGANNRVYWDRMNFVTSISGNSEIPASFELKQNYPNPFNPVTKIEFSLPKEEFVKLSVFDITGREVSTIVSGNLKAGNYKISFDGTSLSSGVYLYKLYAGGFVETRKMLLVK